MELEQKARELLGAIRSQEWARASGLAGRISVELESRMDRVRLEEIRRMRRRGE